MRREERERGKTGERPPPQKSERAREREREKERERERTDGVRFFFFLRGREVLEVFFIVGGRQSSWGARRK